MAVTAKKKKKTKKSIRIQPLGDRIVVERDVTGDVTSGGILLPESAKDKPSRGVVVSVGDGKLLPSGSRSELQVKVGDHVLFTSYGPDEISIDDHELLLMREEDVFAVIN
ncbi:MAG: co-chaperone GroES [Mariniblastus sp.]|nr:co-chaperone GroES [Mariniblastus sp.]